MLYLGNLYFGVAGAFVKGRKWRGRQGLGPKGLCPALKHVGLTLPAILSQPMEKPKTENNRVRVNYLDHLVSRMEDSFEGS